MKKLLCLLLALCLCFGLLCACGEVSFGRLRKEAPPLRDALLVSDC